MREHALLEEHSPQRAAEITGIPASTIESLARAYGQAGKEGRGPVAIRLNYGVQRSENGGTAVRAIAMLPLITGAWKKRGGGLLLSNSGAFPFNSSKLQRPDLMLSSPLKRPARTLNMNELGWALTALNDPRVEALFVYNCNPAAVSPDSNEVLAGLRRTDLFTVVHEQFFTDTADYADVLLPATTFLEHKELMGAYGHNFAQISEQAIEPLGEARSNPWLFGELARRMGFSEDAFAESDDELIDAALDTTHPAFNGITRESLEKAKHLPLNLPRNAEGEALPFSDASWFPTKSGKAELLPLPVWSAPLESRATEVKAVGNQALYPLEFLSRKADNYMNTTFANLPGHQFMERRTAGVLEMHADDADARGIHTGDALWVWNDRVPI